MKAAGIRAKRKGKFVKTTDSRHGYPVAPNVLNRAFTVARPHGITAKEDTRL